MGLSYDIAQIVKADLPKITGIQLLANLETGTPALDLDDLILEAQRSIFRRIKRTEVEPTDLTNQDRLNDAIAYETVRRLAIGGYLDPIGDRAESARLYDLEVKRALDEFQPDLATGEEPSGVGVGVPAVFNLDRPEIPTFVFDDLPEVQ